MSSTSNWMPAILFARTESVAASRPLWRISLDCRMCVNELLCLYRAFVIFFFFFLVCDLVWLLLFLMEKHIKKQYKSTHTCFSLCHTCTTNSTQGNVLEMELNEFDLWRENKKRLLYGVVLTFISPKLFLLTTEKLWRGRTQTFFPVGLTEKNENHRFRFKFRGWLRIVVTICVKIHRSALILQTYRTSVAS